MKLKRNEGRKKPVRSAVWSIIIFTSIISIIAFILTGIYTSSAEYYSLSAKNILEGKYIWTLVTHIFFHANFVHLLVNMFSLYFIGSLAEMIIGKKRFVWFYLISGVFAGIIYVLSAYLGMLTGFESVFGSYDVMAVGASGALFGLVGILAVLIPKKRVYLIIGPIIVLVLDIILSGFLTGGMGTLISVFLNILMFLMIFSIFFPSRSLNKLAIPVSMPMWAAPIAAIVPLVAISLLIELPIGNSAHIGGLIAGLIYGAYLIKRYKKKVSILRNIIR